MVVASILVLSSPCLHQSSPTVPAQLPYPPTSTCLLSIALRRLPQRSGHYCSHAGPDLGCCALLYCAVLPSRFKYRTKCVEAPILLWNSNRGKAYQVAMLMQLVMCVRPEEPEYLSAVDHAHHACTSRAVVEIKTILDHVRFASPDVNA